jgi:3-dehydroquinate synthase
LERVTVPVPGRAYDVVVGTDLLGYAASLLPELPAADAAFVVMDGGLPTAMCTAIIEGLGSSGLRVLSLTIPAGEQAKTLRVYETVLYQLASQQAHRDDVVVALGGGAVGDLAGFVASTYMRGMPVVQVPTTLTGQVDSAIGGKTAVNLPEGKNLVGTFHQPVAVLCDVALLRALPDEELRSGLAEVCKYGFIADPSLLELLERHTNAVFERDAELLTEIVARSAAIKAEIVSADERETTGRRAHLNYGHTFAHAIENAVGYGAVRHGEAVSLGMMAAAYLARELDRIDEDAVSVHRRVLGSLRLPVTAKLDVDALEAAWKRDKKYRGGVRFVLLERIGRPESGVEAPRNAVQRAIERLRT